MILKKKKKRIYYIEPMASALDDKDNNSLSSDQDTNQFLV